MNQTVELMEKIRQAVIDGRLPVRDIPITALKDAILKEIQVGRNTFPESQYTEVLSKLQRLCSDLPDTEQDVGKIILFLDSIILCITMLSKAIKSLACGEYWTFKHLHEMDDPEIAEIVEYIDREQKLQLLNYDFVKKYERVSCEVHEDEASGMSYVPYKGRKMFFPRGWQEEEIRDYYCSVIAEQDEKSPHCYKKENYAVQAGDVVVDAGAAEGIFALDVIDIAQKLYLIEADSQWVEALQHTFQGENKVTIIYGFLDEVMEGNRVSIDGLFGHMELNYIKMDIEGYEKPAMRGAEKTLRKSPNIRCAICSYHCREDEQWLKMYLKELEMETVTSKGYICPDWTISAYLEAELRRGIVFGKK